MPRDPERPSMPRLLRDWFFKSAPTVPTDPLPVVRRRRSDFADPPPDGVRVTWLGHATTLIEIEGARVLVDPVWSERVSPFRFFGPKRFHAPPLPLDELPDLDAVLVSHDHYDHLDAATVRTLAAKGHRFIVPTGVGDRLRRWRVPADRITEVGWWDEVELRGVTVTATPARHFSGRSIVGRDRNRTLWCGFAFVGATRRVYYAGDTAMFDGFEEIGRTLGPFDLTLVEIGAYNRLWADVHLGPEQAVDAVAAAQGGLMLPVHWATFDLAMHGWTEPAERVRIAAEAAGVRLALPRPGASVDPDRPPPLERWWPELPWESADEHPIVSSAVVSRGRQEAGAPSTLRVVADEG